MNKKEEKREKQEKHELGISADKDEFSEWFTQLMIKADLADYTKVSGCMVLKPASYSMWEKASSEIDLRFKKYGMQNVYFPLFIPESLLVKEKEHVEGFTPEVAWVTHAGDTKLNERLAVRPTSEAIMYDSYSRWIRSWRDLPLKYNQWNSVVRWEFKHPTPFLRTREFLWQEGHTAFADQKGAENEGKKIISIYKDVCENIMALPGLVGRKSDKEKFAGAVYTTSIEYYIPNGKAIQGPDFHHDGQNFSKAYDIKFLNKEGKEEYVWQNTFGFTTRMLGIMFAVHSDSKGLIIPPKMAQNCVVIVPILIKGKEEKVIEKAREIESELKKFGCFIDDRTEYQPGFKFNEWELKGIPIRIEIGPKDLEKKQVVLVRRDNGEKQEVKMKDVSNIVKKTLDEIQEKLFDKAKKLLYNNVIEIENYEELRKGIMDKKICLSPLCNSRECEDDLKFKSGGAKVLNIPESQPKKKLPCVICGKDCAYWAYVGRSY